MTPSTGAKEAFSRVVIDAQLKDVGWNLTDGQSERVDALTKPIDHGIVGRDYRKDCIDILGTIEHGNKRIVFSKKIDHRFYGN